MRPGESGKAVTEAINRVVDDIGDDSDGFVGSASARILQRSDWTDPDADADG